MPTGGLKQQWFANMPRIDGGWLARKAREDARPCQRQQQRSSSARSAGRRWHWHERSVLCALHAIGRPNLPLCYVHIRVFCAAPAPPPAGRRVCCRLQDSVAALMLVPAATESHSTMRSTMRAQTSSSQLGWPSPRQRRQLVEAATARSGIWTRSTDRRSTSNRRGIVG